MAKYNIKWDGIDRGHEGLWCPQIWIMPLQALSKFGSFDYDDITHKAYKYLGTSAPEVSWFSEEPSGSRRSLFRDNREPWASTNVISFSGKVMQLSDLGCQIVKGDISYCQVLVQVMSQWKEFDEHPFKILAHAFLELGMYRGIDFDDVVKIMQNYRIGDDLDSALATEIETMPGVAVRRLKAMLLLMTISGAIINVKGRYFAQNISYLKVILEGAERNYKEEFRRWLTEVYRTKEGKTVGATTVGSTVNALLYITDAKSYPGQYDKNSTSYWYNMYHYLYGVDGPSVYTLCNKNEVLEKFNGIYAAVTDGDAPEGVDYQHFQNVLNWGRSENVRKSGWIPYAFSRYFEFLEWREAQNKPEDKKDELPSVDRLGVALKLFAEKRNIDPIEGWTSCDEWAKKVRENFAKADAGMFVAEGFDYAGFMHNFVYNVTVANSYFSKHTEEQKTEVGNFLAQNRNSPKAASWYMDESHFPQVGGSKIPGFGSGVALNFMMKVRPSEFATYSSMIDDMLAFAGLLKSPLPKDVTVEAYEQSKSLQGVVMQKMHEMGIGKAADDNSPADYLTVNEFAWWLNNGKNKDLIKEKIMGNAMKKDKPQKHKGEKALELKKGSKDDELLLRLLASLRAKPFAILAGHSGTGKSRYVKKLAYMTCNAEELRNQNQLPGNYLLLQVKPNWHDSTDLLGYRNAITEGKYQPTELIKFIFRAYQFSETPFFLCLDEMNLAPVEQYFAEFLSAMESKEPVPLNDISEKEGNLFVL